MVLNQQSRFKEIIEPNYNRIYFFLLGKVKDKELAEDLTQNTMEKAWGKLGQLKDDRTAVAWCSQIAENEIKKYYRKATAIKRCLYTEESLNEKQIDVEDVQRDILEEIIWREEGKRAMMALMRVKELYRTVLIMKIIHLLSHEEIAKLLGTNSSTIRNRYARGLRLLRSEFDNIIVPDV